MKYLRTCGTMLATFAWASLALSGCGSSEGSSDNPSDILPDGSPEGSTDGWTENGAPPPVSERPGCVISADCPPGTHCDLEECVQDCNTADPCTGELTCSPRARCLDAEAPDEDPVPTAQYLGELNATPTRMLLTDAMPDFGIQLHASSAEPVRYRVQVIGPHLSIEQERGEFIGSTTVSILVDPSQVKGRDVAGVVKIFTTLGNTVVDAPIHVGLTGSYGGSMRYDGGPVNFGDARIALDMIEEYGDVRIRIDSKSSLLFPGDTTGFGSYTMTNGVDATVAQIIDEDFGGTERNHFQRPIGRKVRFRLKPTEVGDLEGMFEESVFGLFGTMITTSGTVHLRHQAQKGVPSFTLGEVPPMPNAPSATWLDPDDVFGWESEPIDPGPGGWLFGTKCARMLGCALFCNETSIGDAEKLYSTPLYESVLIADPNGVKTHPVPSLVDQCLTSIGAKEIPKSIPLCGLMAPLACGVKETIGLTEESGTTAQTKGILAGRLVSEALAPALLVAKDQVVRAIRESFYSGPNTERLHYDNAMAALAPIMTWLVQPRILEYLQSLPAVTAKGDGSALHEYPYAHSLADAFSLEATIDGERARIGGNVSSSALAEDVQRRAVLGYLQAMVLSELMGSWGTLPNSLKTAFMGMLGPLNNGFEAALNGANAFGVPSGFVPFVFRPDAIATGTTNFEQMIYHASIFVNAEKEAEEVFLGNQRAYEASTKQLNDELTSVRQQFDVSLESICGTGFDPDSIREPTDWVQCGAGQKGEVGVLMLEVDAADARIASAHSRALGMQQKIRIDQDALTASQAVHQQTIQFITSNGEKLIAVTYAQGTLDAIMAAIQVAANSNLLNFGTPAGLAVGTYAAAMAKTALEMERVKLQTAQSLRYEQASAQLEYINAMAAIHKQLVDLQQMSVDLHQDIIGKLQAVLRAQNLVEQARRQHEERGRVLSLLQQSPANDPSFRLLADSSALKTLSARGDAQRMLYLSARALEYELNMSIGLVDGAVLNAHNSSGLSNLSSCLRGIHSSSIMSYGIPQDYVTTVSVRAMLGISGPRTDTVTGQELSEAEQFRQLLLKNENFDGRGGVGVFFATDLLPGNQLWSADVCADRLSAVQAQLVGDFLGDNQAQVNILVSGGSVMRSCDSEALTTWSLGGTSGNDQAVAVVQAGVNTFGEAPPNTSLFGQSVARASWRLVIPGAADAPSNSDVDLTHVDDIVLRFSHKAIPRKTTSLSIDVSCLSKI